MTRVKRLRISLLVTVMMGAVTLSLTGFMPSSGGSTNGSSVGSARPTTSSFSPLVARRDPSDPAAVKGYLERLQRGVASKPRECGPTIRLHGRKARVCQETVDPAAVRKVPWPKQLRRNATDPMPPAELCSKKPGQTNYDRFHACFETVRRIEVIKDGAPQVEGEVRTDVWATLSATNPTWLMQVGVTPNWMSPELVELGPGYLAALACDEDHCKIPDPQRKKIGPGVYTYYELATEIPDEAPGDSIQYSNPQILLELTTDAGSVITPASPANDPFDVRCDSETYIGGHGCVYYMGTAAAATYYISYSGPYAQVAENDLYGSVVRDNLKHYGNIQYGNPLHRADPATHDNNRTSICTTAIKAKASSLGLSCDEYPFANSEEGGTGNPRFSCAFIDKTQNTNQGPDLNKTFVQNRILPSLNEGGEYIQGDPYWVWVTEAPAEIPTVKQCSQY